MPPAGNEEDEVPLLLVVVPLDVWMDSVLVSTPVMPREEA